MSNPTRTVRLLETRHATSKGQLATGAAGRNYAVTPATTRLRDWSKPKNSGESWWQDRVIELELPPDDAAPPAAASASPQRLACSRCGVEVTKDYEAGVCHDGEDSPENGGTLDEHDTAEPWEEVHGAPQKPQGICSVTWLRAGPNDTGWYYTDDDCPDEGSVGPFKTLRETVLHAGTGGYVVGSIAEGEPSPALSPDVSRLVEDLDALCRKVVGDMNEATHAQRLTKYHDALTMAWPTLSVALRQAAAQQASEHERGVRNRREARLKIDELQKRLGEAEALLERVEHDEKRGDIDDWLSDYEAYRLQHVPATAEKDPRT